MNPKNRETAVRKSIRVFVYAILGFASGLISVVWAVPGVPEAVQQYALNNAPQLLLLFGVPTSLVSLIYNLKRDDVRNY